jgi:hypothetical protein
MKITSSMIRGIWRGAKAGEIGEWLEHLKSPTRTDLSVLLIRLPLSWIWNAFHPMSTTFNGTTLRYAVLLTCESILEFLEEMTGLKKLRRTYKIMSNHIYQMKTVKSSQNFAHLIVPIFTHQHYLPTGVFQKSASSNKKRPIKFKSKLLAFWDFFVGFQLDFNDLNVFSNLCFPWTSCRNPNLRIKRWGTNKSVSKNRTIQAGWPSRREISSTNCWAISNEGNPIRRPPEVSAEKPCNNLCGLSTSQGRSKRFLTEKDLTFCQH